MTNGDEATKQAIMEFERSRNQLLNVSAQKQQLQAQSAALKSALDELEKTKEKKVYKAAGNILVLKDTAEVKKETKESKESLDLRIKTLQKQEDSLVNKLNTLKKDIESKLPGAAAPEAEVTETEGKEKKEEKPEKKK